MFKYVDDSTVFDVCNNSSVFMLQASADIITYWSRINDMRINATKTKEMVICFCRNDNHVASIPRIVIDNNDIERVTQAKVLGVTLSPDLTWNAHVDTIVSKARKTVFTIDQLKRAGIRQCDLLRVYVSVIRPVLEYACPVWHTSLPMYLSDNIETIQKRCLRTIFPGHSYDEARSISNLPTLFERRTKLCQSYFRKMFNADHKLNKLLYNTLFSREENFAKSEFEIFSREDIFANVLFTRKYLPAKISSRENIFSRKYSLAKIASRENILPRKSFACLVSVASFSLSAAR